MPVSFCQKFTEHWTKMFQEYSMFEKNKKGISVISCSIKPELCNQMIESVKNTIGTEFETIIFDNREKKLGICQVYNYCAQKANFPYLCFIHEDIIMPTPNWGMNMIAFAEKTSNCGIIGFAGGTTANKNFMAWGYGSKGRYRYYDSKNNGKANSIDDLSYKYNNPENEEFAKVVTLDGLFLLVSREIWKENPFDEERIKEFHFYDADFSLNVLLGGGGGQKRQNYVCLTTDIYHFSGGNYDRAWYENARIFQKKWKQSLPKIIGNQKIGLLEEINSATKLFIQSIRYGFTIKDSVKHFLEINGVFYFFIFCALMLVKITKKMIRRIKSRKLQHRHCA